MNSHLIVAVCVIGCLVAVQATPHDQWDRDGNRIAWTTKELMRDAYDKLIIRVDNFTATDSQILRECLSKFVMTIEKRLLGNRFDMEFERIERMQTEMRGYSLKQFIEFVHTKHESILDTLNEIEMNKLRWEFISFLNDPTPNFMCSESGWSTVFGSSFKTLQKPIDHVLTKNCPFKELMWEATRKLYALRRSFWATEKTELRDIMITLIKRVDQELTKLNTNEMVDRVIKRTSYESMNAIPVPKLAYEAYIRLAMLNDAVWVEKSTTLMNDLIEILNSIRWEILKYNRIE